MKHRIIWPGVVVALSLLIAAPALAAAPATGTVVEGVGVPGLNLENTRAAAEASFGTPESCQTLPYYDGRTGLDGICRFPVDGGGYVTVSFVAAGGGAAEASPDDVVFNIRWSQAVDGWTSTAGVNTTLAINDPEAAIAAYPDAEVIFNPTFGNIESIADPALGILIDYHFQYLTGHVSVSMSIAAPRMPEPQPEQLLRTHSVDLTATKTKGHRTVTALVGVADETEFAAAGANVTATWLLPDGTVDMVQVTTSSTGYAWFQLTDAGRGTYALRVEDVVLDGHRFDRNSSVLSGSVRAK